MTQTTLSAESTPEEVTVDALRRAEQGECITHKLAKQMIAEQGIRNDEEPKVTHEGTDQEEKAPLTVEKDHKPLQILIDGWHQRHGRRTYQIRRDEREDMTRRAKIIFHMLVDWFEKTRVIDPNEEMETRADHRLKLAQLNKDVA